MAVGAQKRDGQLNLEELADQIRAAVPASDARAVAGAHMPTIEVGSTEMPDVLAFLRDLAGHEFKLFCDATAIDREADRGLVEVVYTVRSTVNFADTVTVKTAVDAAEPSMPTSASVLSASSSKAIPTCAASSCIPSSLDTRCARATRTSSASRSRPSVTRSPTRGRSATEASEPAILVTPDEQRK
jgi:Ni,Fe-hydrogenase III component G